MASVTVREVLRQIEAFHRELEGVYSTLAASSGNQRTRMLARHLAEREGRLAKGLDAYEHDARNETTLGYWFKVVPMPAEGLRVGSESLPASASTDDLYAFGLRREEALREFVGLMSEASASPRVQELFTDLMTQEEREQRLTSMARLDAQDL